MTKTQENFTYKRAKRSALSQQETTRLQWTDKTARQTGNINNKRVQGPGSLTWIMANEDIMYWPVAKEISFQNIFTFSSGGHVVQLSWTVWSILLEASCGIFLWNYFEFRPVVQEEVWFKDIYYLELLWPFCLVEQNRLCTFGRRHHEEQLYEFILNLDQWFKRWCRLEIFLRALVALLFGGANRFVQIW